MFFLIVLLAEAFLDVDKEVADVVSLVTKYPDMYGTVELSAEQLILENSELEDVYLAMDEGVFLGEVHYSRQGILDKIEQNKGIIHKLQETKQIVRVTAQGVMTFQSIN